jgi:putative transposase
MARIEREQPPETTFHVTAHANDERTPVFADDLDRQRFLITLADVATRWDWRVDAYCLMDTHYHLLLYTPERSLAHGMTRLNGVYAQSFNRRHQRRGHLFRDRYWSVPVCTDQHLLSAIRYIARNPVEAGLCSDPLDWPWSNCRATAGLDRPLAFLRAARTRRLLAPGEAGGCAQYLRFVGSHL